MIRSGMGLQRMPVMARVSTTRRAAKPSTVSRQLSVVVCFYRTCVIDAILEHSPAAPATGVGRVTHPRPVPPAVRGMLVAARRQGHQGRPTGGTRATATLCSVAARPEQTRGRSTWRPVWSLRGNPGGVTGITPRHHMRDPALRAAKRTYDEDPSGRAALDDHEC
jgi:hypothetical protein